jgi:hypothetical protein
MSDSKLHAGERPSSGSSVPGRPGPSRGDPGTWFALAGLLAVVTVGTLMTAFFLALSTMDMGDSGGGGGRGLLVVLALLSVGAVGCGIQGLRVRRRLGVRRHGTGLADVSVITGASGLVFALTSLRIGLGVWLAAAAIAAGTAEIVRFQRVRGSDVGRAVLGVGLGILTWTSVLLIYGLAGLIGG